MAGQAANLQDGATTAIRPAKNLDQHIWNAAVCLHLHNPSPSAKVGRATGALRDVSCVPPSSGPAQRKRLGDLFRSSSTTDLIN